MFDILGSIIVAGVVLLLLMILQQIGDDWDNWSH
jgi:hypothetical protein